MDKEAVWAALKHYFDYSGTDQAAAHEIYHEDAVLEFPQSGERFEGLKNFREWRGMYPAKVEYEMRRLRGRDDLWMLELVLRYNDGPWNYGIDILEFRGDRVARESIYVTEGWDAPEWRAPWRAAPAQRPDDHPASEPASGGGA